MAQIGKYAEARYAVVDDKRHSVGAVVRGRHGLHAHRAEAQRVARTEMMHVAKTAKAARGLRRAQCLLCYKQRHAELSLVDASARNVIDVIVRYNEGVDLSNVAPVYCKPLLSLPAADARVEKQRYAARLNANAITVAARLQRKHVHRASPLCALPAVVFCVVIAWFYLNLLM